MKERDNQILAKLREDSRKSLSEIGKELGMPTSTVFDRVNSLKKQGLITKCTALMDYSKAGYNYVVNLVLRVDSQDKQSLKAFLLEQQNVNNLYEANDGYVFLLDTIHNNMKDYVMFRELLKSRFKLKELHENIILEDLKREAFINNPD
jgi:DNA-binding Lrp family transcriptional regulator